MTDENACHQQKQRCAGGISSCRRCGNERPNEKQLEDCLELLLGDSDTGIILISQDVYEMGKDIIARRMRDRRLPLLVTIE